MLPKVLRGGCKTSFGPREQRSPKGLLHHPKLLLSGNRKWWRQTGSRQSTPLSTIQTRYGNSVSTPEATRTCKTQQNSLQREADTEFQYRPHIVDTDTIADAVFADAISETSILHPVQNGVAPVQEALCSLGPKDLLHPPPSTFGSFPFSVNFPNPQLPNSKRGKLLLTVGASLLTVKLLCLQSLKALIRRTFPL